MRSRQWCQSSRCSLLLLSHVWSSGPRSLSKVYVQLHTVTACPRVKNPTQPAPQHDEERSTRLTPTRSRHQRPGRHTLHPRKPIRFKLLQSLHTPMIIILISSGSQRDGLDLRLQNRFCLIITNHSIGQKSVVQSMSCSWIFFVNFLSWSDFSCRKTNFRASPMQARGTDI